MTGSARTGCAGREQHFVRLHLDAGRVEQIPKEARHALLLPAVLETLDRLVTKSKVSYPPADLPDGVLRDGSPPSIPKGPGVP